jgi:hypothetical protein
VGNIQKRILFAAWFLSILSFLLIVASTLIHRHRTCYDVLPWVKAPITEITDELGNAFMGYLGVEWMSAHKRPSPAQVLEQGTPLLHGNAFHDDIRNLGRGASRSGTTMYISLRPTVPTHGLMGVYTRYTGPIRSQM